MLTDNWGIARLTAERFMAKSKPKSPSGNIKEGAKKVARGVADAAKKAVGKPRTISSK